MSDNFKQVELAKETLRIFEQNGEQMDDVRHVIHYFYGGNQGALGAALSELGYTVRPTVNDDGVVAERHEAIGEGWRTATLPGLCELADSYGGEYDGWEASMTSQSAARSPAEKKAGWLSKILGKKN